MNVYEPIRPYSFLSLEIRFFEKIGFLNPRFLVKNQTIFIHVRPYSFLSLEIRFFQKIGFLTPAFFG